RVDSRDITSTSIVDQPHETGKSRPARFSDALQELDTSFRAKEGDTPIGVSLIAFCLMALLPLPCPM
ncbi:hypothetical protein, partial [Deinococcus yavapaiensis]|uniref:hypothetical protein n=1 Tax=Deinococcus yavapaiensis TaxID=309889 RepID=UPI001B87E5B3